MRTASLVGLVLFICLTDAGNAAEPDDWLGREVMPREMCTPKVKDQIVPLKALSLPFEVRKVNGEWLWIGRAWVRKGDVIPLGQARAYYTACLKKNPRSSWLYTLRGAVLADNDDLDAARRDFDTAIDLDPANASAVRRRGTVALRNGDAERAMKDFNEAIRLNPDAAAYLSRGRAWEAKGDIELALGDYDNAIRIDPQSSMAHRRRSRVRITQERFDEAIADLSQAIRIDPEESDLYLERGIAWQWKGDFEKALNDYNVAIHFDPHETNAYLARASIWEENNDSATAIQDYSEVIRLDPTSAPAFFGRAIAKRESGKASAAIDDLNVAINLDPKSAKAYRERGVLWYSKLDFERAILDLTASIEIEPTALSYSLRAMAWQFKGEIGNALDDYTELNRLAPNAPLGYVNSAWLRATSPEPAYRNGRLAVECAIKACELTNWTDGEYLVTLAAAYAEAGDFEKAVETQQKARDLAPDNEKAEYQTRVELYKSGKPYRQELKSPPTRRVRGQRSARAIDGPWQATAALESAAKL